MLLLVSVSSSKSKTLGDGNEHSKDSEECGDATTLDAPGSVENTGDRIDDGIAHVLIAEGEGVAVTGDCDETVTEESMVNELLVEEE